MFSYNYSKNIVHRIHIDSPLTQYLMAVTRERRFKKFQNYDRRESERERRLNTTSTTLSKIKGEIQRNSFEWL